MERTLSPIHLGNSCGIRPFSSTTASSSSPFPSHPQLARGVGSVLTPRHLYEPLPFETNNVIDAYTELVESGTITHSKDQEAMCELFQSLENQCKYWEYVRTDEARAMLYLTHLRDLPPRGLYIHGRVGVGKSMLMDLFFDKSQFVAKKRFHFHEFIADIHRRIFRWQQAGSPHLVELRVNAEGTNRMSYVKRPLPVTRFTVDSSNPIESPVFHAMGGVRRSVYNPFESKSTTSGGVSALLGIGKQGGSCGQDTSCSTDGPCGNPEHIDHGGGILSSTVEDMSDGSRIVRGAVAIIARELIEEACLLCFDEFQVTDPGDAHILQALFTELMDLGAICVFTSNRAPENLFQTGFRRSFFIPFVNTLYTRCDVHNLTSVTGDYRSTKAIKPGVFHTSGWVSGPGSGNAMIKIGDNEPDAHAWSMYHDTVAQAHAEYSSSSSSSSPPTPLDTEPMVPFSVQVASDRFISGASAQHRVGLFTFAQLCGRAHGAADYRALGRVMRTVVISKVPQFDWDHRSFGRRFITLIDELYESRVRVRLTSAVPTAELFKYDNERVQEQQHQQGEDEGQSAGSSRGRSRCHGSSGEDMVDEVGSYPGGRPRSTIIGARSIEDEQDHKVFEDHSSDLNVTTISEEDERFAIHRCISRLNHMQSDDYILQPWMAAERDARARISLRFDPAEHRVDEPA